MCQKQLFSVQIKASGKAESFQPLRGSVLWRVFSTGLLIARSRQVGSRPVPRSALPCRRRVLLGGVRASPRQVRGGPLSWPDARATIPESSSSTSRRGVPRDDGLEAEGADGEPQQLDAPGRLEGRAVDVAGR